ncbi:hypothetical protein ACFE04_019474 [Oxalis oulophora]
MHQKKNLNHGKRTLPTINITTTSSSTALLGSTVISKAAPVLTPKTTTKTTRPSPPPLHDQIYYFDSIEMDCVYSGRKCHGQALKMGLDWELEAAFVKAKQNFNLGDIVLYYVDRKFASL